MKKIVLVVSLVLVLSGCNVAYEIEDLYLESQLCDKELYYSEAFDSLKTLDDVSNYIKDSIVYDESCKYQEPRKTLDTGRGDCGSHSVAFANTLYFVTGEKCNLIGVDIDSRTVVNGGLNANHSIIELEDGTQIEPQNGQIRHYEVLYRYSFDDVF